MTAQARLSLPPRLAAVAALVPPGARLVDVGTDHGYLPLLLLEEGRVLSAIATDIAPGPLGRARQAAGERGTALDCRLCDGLAAVSPEEADTVVIAGMGGETIAGILAAAPWTREGRTLLLQPMSKAEKLRPWLTERGYAIHREVLVEDRGKLYPILLARGGHPPPLSPQEVWAGLGRDEPLYPRYLALQIRRLRRAAAGLRRAGGPSAARLAALEEDLKALENVCREEEYDKSTGD